MSDAALTLSSENPMPGRAKEIKDPTHEQIQTAFKQLENDIQGMINKMADLDQEQREHTLVIAQLEKVEPERRCCRMVGGVMAERTVAEIKPQIEANRDKILEFIKKFTEELQKKTETRKQFVAKYGLGNKAQPAAPQEKAPDAAQASAGVLV